MAILSVDWWRSFCKSHGLIYALLGVTITCLTILTIVFGALWGGGCNTSSTPSSAVYAVEKGTIGFPIRLPNDGRYVQWTFLHLNDVYEMLPLDMGRKGGLARVGRIRQLLLKENSKTYTFLAGDLVSPSALSQSIVNGTALNGRQMIAIMNTLGLDFMTFGNHEFDLNQTELTARMNESKFTWISSNVFREEGDQPFASSIPYKLITIEGVHILIIGLTIDTNDPYVRIINQSSLVTYTQQFLTAFPNGTYDVLVGLTHLDIATDIQLVEKIPQIDLILGGHEHEDYYYLRGTEYTPIYKADANAFTVYIHRCAYNLDTKRLRIYSTLAQVTPDVQDEEKTAMVANYWFNLGIQGFEAIGFQPNKIVSCLPAGVELDGRSESVRSANTVLTDLICESMIEATALSGTTIGVFNSGAIRVDDVLRNTIDQYDILRTLPFADYILALSVPGQLLARVLSTGISIKGDGMFLSYTGVQTSDQGKTWLVNGVDISISNLNYNVATTDYARANTEFNNTNATILQHTNMTQTQSLINYLNTKYPPC
ncbi:unnamed protein product [Didymodactylos carnosus]|uniref:5'-nucleotidase n=1 Tax=Didymodactylos carnosus TaxID=1234261 RepID=A0A815SVJ4_9BILA|nr:unnamed protein product [Didymodactylos carnosus]CAF1493031.1 unnamed protein product [Didymodactylos carnosus]CAF4159245.1 unnamed protein product [Didymodactylos carnosus]CAF4355834.1 unnamed protein product [Didymodactylos carnosus]